MNPADPVRTQGRPTVAQVLLEGERRLAATGFVLRPRRHAELLLECALGVDRVGLYLRAGEPIPPEAAERFWMLAARREAGEPVQYIVGWAPFYGRRFAVGRGVFIPRFDSEVIVERAVALLRSRPGGWRAPQVLDVCCGCGVLGLSIAAEQPTVRVVLSDRSEIALDYAARNALALLVNDRAETVRWDALTPPPAEWRRRFALVVANPPYVPAAEVAHLHPDVRDFEPREALTDGADGLTFHRTWAALMPEILQVGGTALVEVGDGQAAAAAALFKTCGADVRVIRDLSGVERVLEICYD